VLGTVPLTHQTFSYPEKESHKAFSGHANNPYEFNAPPWC